MNDHPIAWFLNFDADAELAQLRGRYTSPSSVIERSPGLVQHLSALFSPGDVVLATSTSGPINVPTNKAGFRTRAWCPTPLAKQAIEKLGMAALYGPALDLLRRVNHRQFAYDLGVTLPQAMLTNNLAEIEATIKNEGVGDGWLIKRPLSFAGRGRRLVRAGSISKHDAPWITGALDRGETLTIEPYVKRLLDAAIHGYVSESGTTSIGQPTVQECDDSGAWVATRLAVGDELFVYERDALDQIANRVAVALKNVGYFGPFGVDAFRWQQRSGEVLFHPLCEINARYTMGWSIGMGTHRPDRAQ